MKFKIILMSLLIVISLSSLYFFMHKPQTIDSYLIRYQKQHILSGAVLIARKDTIAYLNAFGLAAQEKNIKNTSSSEFLIGSLTKQFTAAAILGLVDKGLLELDKSVSTYLPSTNPIWLNNMPDWADQITIHHLLSHSSGLPEYVALPGFEEFYKNPHTTTELIQFFANHPLNFKPGTQYAYSGSGYNLLGAIIETVSWKDYETFLHDIIFKPLHLQHIYAPATKLLSEVKKEHPNISVGYNLDTKTNQFIPAGQINLSTAFAEASIIADAADLYKSLLAIFTGNIISQNMLQKMTTPSFTTEEGTGVGYGIFIDKSLGFITYAHSGRINGYESISLYEPRNEITVIILSNILGSNIYGLAYELMALVHAH